MEAKSSTGKGTEVLDQELTVQNKKKRSTHLLFNIFKFANILKKKYLKKSTSQKKNNNTREK